MMQRLMTLAFAAAALVLGTGQALAHEEFRVIGTLLRHQNSQIEVQSKDGRTTLIRLDKQTAITKDDKPADATDLTAGRSVVVDAFGDSEADLLAIEIRIVPPIPAR